MNVKALVAAAKEGARIALFAAISALLAWAGEKLGGMDPNSMQVVIGTVVLRLLDKFVHKNEDLKVKGLAPF